MKQKKIQKEWNELVSVAKKNAPTRFDLEEKIMQSWSTQEDIDILLRSYADGSGMTEDEIANALIGISALHKMRMQEVWDCYDNLLKEGKL